MEMDERAAYYLKALAEDGEVPGGLAFRTALRQSKLDGSVDSLDRVDHLLDQVRLRFKPEYDSFVAPKSNQNFLFLLVFYVGSVVSRHSQMPLRWLGYDEMLARFPTAGTDYPKCLATEVVCVLGGNIIFVPLSPILERLFDAQPGQGVRASASQYIVDRRGLLAFREPSPSPAADAPERLQRHGRAMHRAGNFAAQRVWSASEGRTLVPTFGAALRDGRTFVTPLMHYSAEHALGVGLQRLEGNPDGALHTVLVYDTRVTLATGPSDAIVIEVRAYPERAGPDFVASLLVPYRRQDSPAGFAVQAPTLLGCSADAASLPMLVDCFYRGVHEQAEAAAAWRRHLDEGI